MLKFVVNNHALHFSQSVELKCVRKPWLTYCSMLEQDFNLHFNCLGVGCHVIWVHIFNQIWSDWKKAILTVEVWFKLPSKNREECMLHIQRGEKSLYNTEMTILHSITCLRRKCLKTIEGYIKNKRFAVCRDLVGRKIKFMVYSWEQRNRLLIVFYHTKVVLIADLLNIDFVNP